METLREAIHDAIRLAMERDGVESPGTEVLNSCAQAAVAATVAHLDMIPRIEDREELGDDADVIGLARSMLHIGLPRIAPMRNAARSRRSADLRLTR